MKYREYEPHRALANDVKCFWNLERTYPPDSPFEDVIPDACVELILNFGDPYVLCAEGVPERSMPPAFLVGFQKAPLRFRCDGTVRLVAVRFHAWGVLPFVTAPRRRSEPVCADLGADWYELLDAIATRVLADDAAGAVARIEEFLLEKLVAAAYDRGRVRAAAQMLLREKGQVRIAELAERCHVSVRQLERQMKDAAGVAPKTLARTMRFDAARERLMFAPETNLTELALACGYADQAHFIREFRSFANRTPGEFADDMRALQSILREGNVAFLRPPAAG